MQAQPRLENSRATGAVLRAASSAGWQVPAQGELTEPAVSFGFLVCARVPRHAGMVDGACHQNLGERDPEAFGGGKVRDTGDVSGQKSGFSVPRETLYSAQTARHTEEIQCYESANLGA